MSMELARQVETAFMLDRSSQPDGQTRSRPVVHRAVQRLSDRLDPVSTRPRFDVSYGM